MTWRIGLAALAMSACGRISFDAEPGTDAAAIDAPPDGPCTGPGHDEDHDGHPDACDPCPHLAGDLTDSDHDGVGDACDPEPTNPRQSIAEFLAFDVVPPAPWFFNGGITLDDDQLVFESRDNAVTGYRPWTRGTSTFAVGYHTGVGMPGTTRIIALFTRDGTAPRTDLYCETIQNEDNTRVQLTYTHDGSNFPHIDPQVAPVSMDNQSGTMTFTTGANLACDVTFGAVEEHAAGPDDSDVIADTLVLYNQSIPVAFDWFIEIRTAD